MGCGCCKEDPPHCSYNGFLVFHLYVHDHPWSLRTRSCDFKPLMLCLKMRSCNAILKCWHVMSISRWSLVSICKHQDHQYCMLCRKWYWGGIGLDQHRLHGSACQSHWWTEVRCTLRPENIASDLIQIVQSNGHRFFGMGVAGFNEQVMCWKLTDLRIHLRVLG